MYSLLRKSPWKSSAGERKGAWSKLIMVFTLNVPFICYLSRIVIKVLWTSIISYAVVQYLSLLHNFAKESQNPGSVHCRFVQIFDKDLKCLIYLGYWRTKHCIWIWKQWMVSFRRTYCDWLSITYLILLRVFRFFLFFSFFLVFLRLVLHVDVLR